MEPMGIARNVNLSWGALLRPERPELAAGDREWGRGSWREGSEPLSSSIADHSYSGPLL